MNIVALPAPPLVGELMTTEPVLVRADARLVAAATLLDRHRIHGRPVVDGGVPVGVPVQSDPLRARATAHHASGPGAGMDAGEGGS